MIDDNSSTLMIYGDSGLGKSTQAAVFSKFVYEKTRKPVRLIMAEDSSRLVFAPLIEVGVVEVFPMTKVKNPDVTLRRLAEGQWPVNGKWAPYEPGSVGGYVVEGLSSSAEQLMEWNRENHRFLEGQTANVITVKEDDNTVWRMSASTRVNYGMVQDEMVRAVKAFAQLKGLYKVLWTAHEVKGQDSDANTLRGPAIVGSAKTSVVQKYVGTLLHLDGILQKDGKVKPRMYFQSHADQKFEKVYYPAKVTVPRDAMLARFPDGYIDPGIYDGIDKLLIAEDEIQLQTINSLKQWKANLSK